MPTLEPHDADECEAVTAQLVDDALTALANDDLYLAESYLHAIKARVATLTAALDAAHIVTPHPRMTWAPMPTRGH